MYCVLLYTLHLEGGMSIKYQERFIYKSCSVDVFSSSYSLNKLEK